MSVNLSPIGNGVTFLGNTGLPLAGGLLYTYQAGSSTPLATYQDNNGLIQNSNPIVLGTDGKLPSELWLTYGYTYKFVLKDSAGTLINTYDNIYGILGTIPAVASAFTAGMIMLWSGSIGSIPSGWTLCNGSNGAPDLRNRFVIAAGDGKVLDNGTKIGMSVKVGDKVLFGKYSGTEVKVGAEELVVMREDDIMAVIEEK